MQPNQFHTYPPVKRLKVPDLIDREHLFSDIELATTWVHTFISPEELESLYILQDTFEDESSTFLREEHPEQCRPSRDTEESSTFLHLIKGINLLNGLYNFTNSEEIEIYLLRNENLVDSLFEIDKQVRKFYGKNIKNLELQYEKDPEEDSEWLSVVITTSLPPNSALDILDKFDETWWLNIEHEIRNKITIIPKSI